MGEQVYCQTPGVLARPCRDRALTVTYDFGNMVTMAKNKIRPRVYDTENTTKEYWEQILKAEGLSLDAGRHQFRDASGRLRDRLIHVGGASNLDALHEMLIGDNGRVTPKGAGPDE